MSILSYFFSLKKKSKQKNSRLFVALKKISVWYVQKT